MSSEQARAGGGRRRLGLGLGATALAVLLAVGAGSVIYPRLAGAGAGGASASPSTGPAPTAPRSSASAQLEVAGRLGLDRRATAALVVLTSDPTLLGFGQRSAGGPSIGSDAMYYETSLDGADVLVHLHVGWGDCPAGCTSFADTTFRVTPDGAMSLVSRSDRAVPADVLGAPSGDGALRFSIVDGPACLSDYQAGHAAARTLEVTLFRANGTSAETHSVASCVRGERFYLPAGVYIVRVVDTGKTPSTSFVVFSVGADQEVWTGVDLLPQKG